MFVDGEPGVGAGYAARLGSAAHDSDLRTQSAQPVYGTARLAATQVAPRVSVSVSRFARHRENEQDVARGLSRKRICKGDRAARALRARLSNLRQDTQPRH